MSPEAADRGRKRDRGSAAGRATALSGGSLVTARGLCCEIGGRRLVGPLDLEVRRGDCLVVVGPNGAGKTTLLRLLAGVWRPTGGELAWEGTPYRRLRGRALARRVAYVPQVRPAAVPLTVQQLVLLGRYPYLSPWRAAPAAADWGAVRRALETVGLAALGGRRVEQLSGGERQSAYVAAALAQESELLVLDEPTTHLDPRHQRQVAELIARLRGKGERPGGRTVVAATHDLHLAGVVADRVLALREGRALAAGPPAELLAPAALEALFDAPFLTASLGGRPFSVLALGEEAPPAGPPPGPVPPEGAPSGNAPAEATRGGGAWREGERP